MVLHAKHSRVSHRKMLFRKQNWELGWWLEVGLWSLPWFLLAVVGGWAGWGPWSTGKKNCKFVRNILIFLCLCSEENAAIRNVSQVASSKHVLVCLRVRCTVQLACLVVHLGCPPPTANHSRLGQATVAFRTGRHPEFWHIEIEGSKFESRDRASYLPLVFLILFSSSFKAQGLVGVNENKPVICRRSCVFTRFAWTRRRCKRDSHS